MKTLRLLPLALMLAACGVDGPPVAPKDVDEAPRGGITISGSAEVGIRRTF